MPADLSLLIPGRARASRVLLDHDLADLAGLAGGRAAIIVTDGNVRRCQGPRFPGWPVVEVGTGEAAKTLATVETLARALIAARVDRRTLVVGLGGGVVSDVTGFVASTLLRGVPFAFAPTSLLAQVDAAIGGKNGVNLDGFKNLIGTVTQPEFVLADHRVLETLPAAERRSGVAEVIKAAAIGDAALFTLLEADVDAVLACARPAVARVVERAVRIKLRLVAADERDDADRRLLNFGHTLGHAVERVFGFSHGEAVAIGMVAAARVSVARGLLARGDAERIERLVRRAGLPAACPPGRWADLLAAIEVDKKRVGGRQSGVLVRGIGEAIVADVADGEWQEALA
jgi:3-dehydroquinate synthase